MLKIIANVARGLFEMAIHYLRIIRYVVLIFVMCFVALPIMGFFSGNEEKK